MAYRIHTRLTVGLLLIAVVALALPAGLAGCRASGDHEVASGRASDAGGGSVAEKAQNVEPIGAGRRAPAATLMTMQNQPYDLADAYAAGPTVLVFYRGGWCPYCNRHLAELRHAVEPLNDMGVQLIAVSPDRPAELRKTAAEQELDYLLLSDASMQLARDFGIAFRVPDQTVSKYLNEYRIDLEAASGRSHHQLPVPAVYVIDRDRVIRFVHYDPDYKQRLDHETLIAAARAAVR